MARIDKTMVLWYNGNVGQAMDTRLHRQWAAMPGLSCAIAGQLLRTFRPALPPNPYGKGLKGEME
jgi:hypothetical protein